MPFSLGIFPIDRTKYPEKRFDPRLMKRYAKWCQMGKPDDMMEELARAPNTPQKLQQHFEESASSSRADESIRSLTTPSTPSTLFSSSNVPTSKQLESTPTIASTSTVASIPTVASTPTIDPCCEVSKLIGPKPMPYPGKIWVPCWVLQDPPSIFEEKVLSAIKGPLDKPKPVRRKVDWKTKVMSSENYLEKLCEANEKKPSKKRQKIDKEKEDKEDQMVESETEEEIIESSEAEEEGEEEEKLIKLWKWLSPPTPEDKVKGKWFAVVFKPESKLQKKRSSPPSLYIGKATTRFLVDQDGPACGIEFDCLKPHVGSGNTLESYTGASRHFSFQNS